MCVICIWVICVSRTEIFYTQVRAPYVCLHLCLVSVSYMRASYARHVCRMAPPPVRVKSFLSGALMPIRCSYVCVPDLCVWSMFLCLLCVTYVCVQLYMNMYTGTHSCMHACTHTHAHTCMHACMHDARASSRVAGTTFPCGGPVLILSQEIARSFIHPATLFLLGWVTNLLTCLCSCICMCMIVSARVCVYICIYIYIYIYIHVRMCYAHVSTYTYTYTYLSL